MFTRTMLLSYTVRVLCHVVLSYLANFVELFLFPAKRRYRNKLSFIQTVFSMHANSLESSFVNSQTSSLRLIFRCGIASLYEDPFAGSFIRPSVSSSVRPSTRPPVSLSVAPLNFTGKISHKS